jgi:hypothetical protein
MRDKNREEDIQHFFVLLSYDCFFHSEPRLAV